MEEIDIVCVGWILIGIFIGIILYKFNIYLYRFNNLCYKMWYICSIWFGYEWVYMYLVKDKE